MATTESVDALVVFGGTGDLAKLETSRRSPDSRGGGCSTCP